MIHAALYIINPQASISGQHGLSGHYDCTENILTNCGSSSASLAFPVIGLGVVVFGLSVRHRRRSHSRKEKKKETVSVDKEGWETKAT
jgi:hypothetical protein